MSDKVGLSKKDIRQVLQKHLDKNADLLIGIDDPEMVLLIDVLCDGIAEAIAANNEKMTSDNNHQAFSRAMRL